MGMYRVPESTEKLNVDYVQTGEANGANGESVHRMYTIGVHARENRSFIITGSTADRPSTDIQGYAP